MFYCPPSHCSVCPEGLQAALHVVNEGWKQHSGYSLGSTRGDFHITEKCLDKNRMLFNLANNLQEDEVFILLIKTSPQ